MNNKLCGGLISFSFRFTSFRSFSIHPRDSQFPEGETTAVPMHSADCCYTGWYCIIKSTLLTSFRFGYMATINLLLFSPSVSLIYVSYQFLFSLYMMSVNNYMSSTLTNYRNLRNNEKRMKTNDNEVACFAFDK